MKLIDRLAPRPDALTFHQNGKPNWTREMLIAEIRTWAETHGGNPPRTVDWTMCHARRLGHEFFEAGWPSTSVVVQRFGSWAAGLEAAGFTAPRRGGETVVVRCVDCGREKRTIAARFTDRCKRCTDHLRETGERWSAERAEEARRAHTKRLATETTARARERYARLIEMRRQGLSNIEIAEREGVSAAAINTAFSHARSRGFDVPTSSYFKAGRA